MIFKKLIQLYAAVDYTKCACKHQVYSSEVHQLALFSSFYVEFSVQILVKTASIDNMFLVFFFIFSFFCLPNLEDCEPVVWRHLISCVLLVIVLSNNRLYSLQTIHCFYRDVLLNCPACWTCMVFVFCFFFPFLCLKMSFLSDDSSMAFILHLWPPHFFGTATKKWQDFPPPHPTPLLHVIYTSAFQLCWSAPPSAVIRLRWMRYAFLMEVDRRGSWCEGWGKRLHY